MPPRPKWRDNHRGCNQRSNAGNRNCRDLEDLNHATGATKAELEPHRPPPDANKIPANSPRTSTHSCLKAIANNAAPDRAHQSCACSAHSTQPRQLPAAEPYGEEPETPFRRNASLASRDNSSACVATAASNVPRRAHKAPKRGDTARPLNPNCHLACGPAGQNHAENHREHLDQIRCRTTTRQGQWPIPAKLMRSPSAHNDHPAEPGPARQAHKPLPRAAHRNVANDFRAHSDRLPLNPANQGSPVPEASAVDESRYRSPH